MELVYLWVEDYKNIKKQGFNFSPKFECKYDEDAEELTIDKKEHLENFFGENINITAIVGENGSGKSNIFEKLLNLFAKKSNDDYNKFICLYLYNNELYQYTNIKSEKLHYLVNHCTNNHILSEHNDLIALYINNQYETVEDRDSEQLFTENSKYSKNYINKILISNYINYKQSNQTTQKFFKPTKVMIKISGDNFINHILNEDRDYYKDETWVEVTEEKSKLKNSTFFNKLKIIEKIFNIKKDSHNEVPSYTILEDRNDKSYFNRKYTIKENFISNVPQIIQDNDSINNNFEIIMSDITPQIFQFIQDLPYIFDIIVQDDNISFNDLSYGERQLLVQLNFILFYLNQDNYEKYWSYQDEKGGEEGYATKKIDKIIVLLDEFELGLHPNWQKKFISYIIDFFKDIKKDISIVIATHSPFLLSDLSKENIIFLKKNNEIGNCINATKDIDINPFGANIHTLLSHGFFMQDGLMGEFAKGKIEDLINYLNDKESDINDNNEAQKLLNIIGEPVIKNQLQKMLDSKRLSKVDKIDVIERQIKELQEELKKVK
ncbi:MAG: ATP-binding protein [Sulfurimonas sp.]|nr:ATP-binding protein [Sulfurimonas sp.]